MLCLYNDTLFIGTENNNMQILFGYEIPSTNGIDVKLFIFRINKIWIWTSFDT